MFSFRTTPLAEQEDKVLRSGRLGVLCNQVAWNPEQGEYIFETLHRKGNLKRVFIPSWCSFDGSVIPCEFVSLTDEDAAFSLSPEMFSDLDALVVEFQDLGSRYDKFTSLLFNLFLMLHHSGTEISVYILDRNNPSGRGVEGTMLYPEFESAVGVEGIPHRHGLTLGELSNLFYSEIGAKFPLHIISYMVRSATQFMMPWSIPPYEEVPGLFTSTFYCGQIIFQGTNVSCGVGTTRPFEVFGAPYMKALIHEPVTDPGVFMRWTMFTPRYGMYAGEACYGFQMLPYPGVQYHSLGHSLRILHGIKSRCAGFRYDSLESMVGDETLFGYVTGDVKWDEVKEHIKLEEQKWIRKAKRYMLYDDQLTRVKTLI